MAFLTVVVASLVAAVAMEGVIAFAQNRNLYDVGGGRKIHKVATPRLGGVAIMAGFIAGLGVAMLHAFSGDPRFVMHVAVSRWLVLALGGAVMFFLGLWDDLKPIAARHKLIVQILVATSVVMGEWRFIGFSHLPDLMRQLPVWVSGLITVGWIVGMSNAINLIDGMDGLSAGISVLAAAAFGIMHAMAGHFFSSLVACAVAGALLGFLGHNFPFPGRSARIFMGDSGSLSLGYALAVLPLMNPVMGPGTGSSQTLGLFSCMAVLSIPIIDTLNAIRRRQKAHIAFSVPDKRHIHHILLDLGFSVRQVLAIAYSATAIMGASAVLAFSVSRLVGAAIMIAVTAVLLAFWVQAYHTHKARQLH